MAVWDRVKAIGSAFNNWIAPPERTGRGRSRWTTEHDDWSDLDPGHIPLPEEDAVFTLDHSDETDAEFTPVPEDATFSLDVRQLLLDQGISSAEAAFLAGDVKYVISTNVAWIQYVYLDPDNPETLVSELLVGYKDGSAYAYSDIPISLARQFYGADSYGKFVWDNLRVRGTVFGYQYDYRLVAGSRVWYNAGAASQARHEAIPRSGEPEMDNTQPYHPALNWKGAPGKMGAASGGKSLGKKGGSAKVAQFISAAAAHGHIPRTGPFRDP